MTKARGKDVTGQFSAPYILRPQRIGRVGKHGLEGVPLDGSVYFIVTGRLLLSWNDLRDVQVQ